MRRIPLIRASSSVSGTLLLRLSARGTTTTAAGAVTQFFTGFPTTNTPPYTAATSVTVDRALLEAAVEKAFINPQQRVSLCLQALKDIKEDAEVKAALEWEKGANIAADKYPMRVMTSLFLALLLQNVVLTYWVFIAFDWNLVEPCTYFFGYTSLTWFALVFYKFTGREFTYDAMIEELRRRKFAKLTYRNEHHTQVLADFRHREAVLLRELEGLGYNIPAVE